MKKLLTFFLTGAALAALGTTFTACNTPKDPEQNEGTEIQSVSVSDEVANFFDDHQTLKAVGNAIFRTVDENRLVNMDSSDSFVMINSADELPKIDFYGNPLDFPAIDFESQTLVIGEYEARHGGECVVSQRIIVENDVATMTITVGLKGGDEFHHYLVEPDYFWGMYPKIDASTINLIITRKN